MTKDELVNAYGDHAVVEMELMNARREFGFSIHDNKRDFMRMLWKEKVEHIVISNMAYNFLSTSFWTCPFGLVKHRGHWIFHLNSIMGILDDRLDCHEMLLLCEDGVAKKVNIKWNLVYNKVLF